MNTNDHDERELTTYKCEQEARECHAADLERHLAEALEQLAGERALADRLAQSMERMRMECYSKAYEEWKAARKEKV